MRNVYYKFMIKDSKQHDFEAEVKRYQILKGCEGIPAFRGVVRREGFLHGFLISYNIDGCSLWTLVIQKMISSETPILAALFAPGPTCRRLHPYGQARNPSRYDYTGGEQGHTLWLIAKYS